MDELKHPLCNLLGSSERARFVQTLFRIDSVSSAHLLPRLRFVNGMIGRWMQIGEKRTATYGSVVVHSKDKELFAMLFI
jgi:hypothetical protein